MKITFREMREMGLRGFSSTAIAAITLRSTPIDGLTTFVYRISNHSSSVGGAVVAGPMCGPTSPLPKWAPVHKARQRGRQQANHVYQPKR